MIDEKTRAIIMARARLADASLAIGNVYSSLFNISEDLPAILRQEPGVDALRTRMFACYLEAMRLAEALGEYEKEA